MSSYLKLSAVCHVKLPVKLPCTLAVSHVKLPVKLPCTLAACRAHDVPHTQQRLTPIVSPIMVPIILSIVTVREFGYGFMRQ